MLYINVLLKCCDQKLKGPNSVFFLRMLVYCLQLYTTPPLQIMKSGLYSYKVREGVRERMSDYNTWTEKSGKKINDRKKEERKDKITRE